MSESNAPYVTGDGYLFIAFQLIIMSGMSLGINSIYINNYMTRKTTPFKDILNKDEVKFMFATFGMSIFYIIVSLFFMVRKYIKPKPVYCPTLLPGNIPFTYANIATAITTVGKSCDTLAVCKDATEQLQNEKIAKETDKICTPNYYSTNTLWFAILVISGFALSVSSIMWYDMTMNGAQTHSTTPSTEKLFIMCLIFAIVSGIVPVIMFTYARATTQAGQRAVVIETKLDTRPVQLSFAATSS